jgi:hypothetical protein
MDQAEFLVGQDPDREPARSQELEQPGEARLGGVAAPIDQGFGPLLAPLLSHGGLG